MQKRTAFPTHMDTTVLYLCLMASQTDNCVQLSSAYPSKNPAEPRKVSEKNDNLLRDTD